MRNQKLFKNLFRKKNQIYIIPTKMGGYLIGLIFLMFLLSIGYNNNLLLIFTLLLFTFNILWLVQTHFFLKNLKLNSISLANGHVGENQEIKLSWNKELEYPSELETSLETEDISVLAASGLYVLPHRGVWNWKFLKVSSEYPFGLYRAWRFFPLSLTSYSYPSLTSSIPDKFKQGIEEGYLSSEQRGHDDIKSLGQYHGEEARRISWKHYARSGELLIKEGERNHQSQYDIVLDIPKDSAAKEVYLSSIASQMVVCYQRQIPFSLAYNETHFRPGHHKLHLEECLKVLAKC